MIWYDSHTFNRINLKENLNKTTKVKDNPNKKKIYVNRELVSPSINKEILFPQTPQIRKEIFMNSNKNSRLNSDFKENRTIEYIDKSEEQQKNDVNFLKEYKEILEKFTKTINANIGVTNNESDNK